MPVAWTRHRFSGGALALDTANTVVLRNRPSLSFDRFADPAEIGRFAAAASRFRGQELGGRVLLAPDPASMHAAVLALRESADGLFRCAAAEGRIRVDLMPGFLRACADGFDQASTGVDADQAQRDGVHFASALAASALSLLPPQVFSRIRICPNCDWLFLDQSRNGSRIWCDMAVCGNRAKARRHYRRRRAGPEEVHHD